MAKQEKTALDIFKLKMQFSALQFSDPKPQQVYDVQSLFTTRPFAHKTRIKGGTETGDPDFRDIIRGAARLTNHRTAFKGDVWLAVDKHFINGGWDQGWIPVLDPSEGKGKHSARGILWVSFNNNEVGRITIGCAHYLTKGRRPGDPNYELNGELIDATAQFGRDFGKGDDLVFMMADGNIPDDKFDVFRGGPFTTAADELGRHPNTGYGPIDWIASYDRDGRVEAGRMQVMSDKTLFLYTDHFPKIVTWDIVTLQSYLESKGKI